MIATRSYIILCLCLSSFKLLFLKSYVSTDFDVHRNWMSITYNLSLRDWYFDTTSQWTLDYPPLFAVFELLLALCAHLLNLQDALKLSKSAIRSEQVIVYQKVTVITSDFVYFYGVYKLCRSLQPLLEISSSIPGTSHKKSDNNGRGKNDSTTDTCNETSGQESKDEGAAQDKKKQVSRRPSSPPPQEAPSRPASLQDAIHRPDATSCIAVLLLLQPGLLLVDHIHFQYNGLLSGVLLLSIADIINGRYISGSFWFAVLLNLKHIYLYCAPAYGMYLLASHCLVRKINQNGLLTFLLRAGRLGSVVIMVLAITYVPFSDQSTLKQIVSRLFPFKRGLTHAYWAPNVWSLYNLADKILASVFKHSLRVTFDLESISRSRRISSTSGLVQEYEHMYLPCVKPVATFALVGAASVPIVIKFLLRTNRRSPRLFLKGVTLAAFTSFMFGWHVHEKAILLVILPMVPLCFTDPQLRDTFLRLTLAGTYSLFPLLNQAAEYPTKVCLLLAYYGYARSRSLIAIDKMETADKQDMSLVKTLRGRIYSLMDNAYVVTLVMTELYITIIFGRMNFDWNPLAKLNRYEFLPLMLSSTLSALGITISYLELYYDFVSCADELATSL